MSKKKNRRATTPAPKPAPSISEPVAVSSSPAATDVARSAVLTTKPRKTSKLGQARRGRRKSNNLPWILGLGGLALLVLFQVGLNLYRDFTAPGDRFRSQGNVHVALGTTTPAYNSDPPTSGWHTPDLAPWGSSLVVQPDQRVIHNMEDGGVILWYRLGSPEENEANVALLESVVEGRFGRTVITPRADLQTPYVLTAWTRMQTFEDIDPEGMRAFIAAYHGIDHHP